MSAAWPPVESLEPLRREIDAVDDALVDLLARRFALVRQVAALKRQHGLAVVQGARAEAVKARTAARAAASGIDPALVQRLWTALIDEAHRIEGAVVDAGARKAG